MIKSVRTRFSPRFSGPLLYLTLILLANPNLSTAQVERDSLQTIQSRAPKVFLDCNRCDRDFIRKEITFTNFVRDRQGADVHILVTTQRTGSGGTEYTFNFIGRDTFSGMADTLVYASAQTDTDDDTRRDIVKYFKMGLMRYIAKTPLAEQITISHAQATEIEPADVRDKWNYWVFRLSLRGFFSGQESRTEVSIGGSSSANRITDKWKTRLSTYYDFNRETFPLETTTGDDSSGSSTSKNYGFNAQVVKSLNDHWSAGLFGEAESSTFDNTDLELTLAPAVEYNLFPYSESTRRELRFTYRAGYNGRRYMEETLFNKTSEDLFRQELEITLETKQPWGEAEFSLEGSNFFHDFSKHRLQLFGELEFQLFKGFSLDLFGRVERVKDQLSLPKDEDDLTLEDILLRRRELGTSYRYFMSIRLSYTFGSIYSNVVNPRFGR